MANGNTRLANADAQPNASKGKQAPKGFGGVPSSTPKKAPAPKKK